MSAAVQHLVRIPEPQLHRLEVESRFPTGGAAELELAMAVWTPGSYLVREFARHVEGLAACDETGRPLAARKVRKNRWAVSTGGAERVVVRYRLYCRQMSVQTNFVDSTFALLNAAGVFLTRPAANHVAHEVRLELPAGWARSISPLPALDGVPHGYLAADYDTLVDSPLYAGNAALYEFAVDGVPHLLDDEGEGGIWDGRRAAGEVERIVRTQWEFWGELPYARFVFFNLITEAGGGLEHRESTVLMTSRWKSRTRKGWLDWLSLVSHELFHAWNVKRLRPVELGPFDYEGEVYTESLWIAEGITSYYDDLLVARAGLSTREEYLKQLSATIERVQTTPGRLAQPLALSSFDTWIKLYRPDESSVNTGISYYPKGALVAWLLDCEIRRTTAGARSLDDVLRAAYRRFSGERGFAPREFEALADDIAGIDLGAFFDRAVRSVEELDYSPALAWLGLHFKPPEAAEKKPGEEEKPPKGWLGAKTRPEDGRLLVAEVPRGTPAEAAGLNAEDEIVALAGYRVRAAQWEERLESYRPGETTTLTIARRERLLELPLAFGEEPKKIWILEADPGADAEQRARLAAWLGEPGG